MRFVCGLLALLPLLAAAETGYVTDRLVLGLHQAEDTSDRAFRSLESGQAFEVLSRDRLYAHIQLPDGTQGYVKAAYLVYDKPAKLIVNETQAEVDRLTAELEEAREAFAEPAAVIDRLKADAATLQGELDVNRTRVEELENEKKVISESLKKLAYLAAFIPVIMGMGGNIGTQTSTIVVLRSRTVCRYHPATVRGGFAPVGQP